MCLEGKDHNHKWEPGSKYLAEYEHPLWKQALERAARESGTAGGKPAPITAEFLEDSRLIQALQAGVPPDFDVYDAATWSVVSAAEREVRRRPQPPRGFPRLHQGEMEDEPARPDPGRVRASASLGYQPATRSWIAVVEELGASV